MTVYQVRPSLSCYVSFLAAYIYLSWQLTSGWSQVTIVSTLKFTALLPTPANNLIPVLLLCVFSNVVQ